MIDLAKQGKSQKDIAEEIGLSATTVRRELERQKIADAAKAEAEAEAKAEAEGEAALASLSMTAKKKVEAAMRKREKEIEKRIRTQLLAEADQFKAEANRLNAEYRAKLDARAKLERENRDKEREEYKRYVEVYRAKGLITPSEYKTILGCLHPDTRMHEISDSNSDAFTKKLNMAFDLFNNPKIKALLVKEIEK